MPKIKTCIVKGCPNRSNEGKFKGKLCYPCFKMLKSGESKPSKNFIKQLFDENARLKELTTVLEKQYNKKTNYCEFIGDDKSPWDSKKKNRCKFLGFDYCLRHNMCLQRDNNGWQLCCKQCTIPFHTTKG